jgi:dephospho-CoA kinase
LTAPAWPGKLFPLIKMTGGKKIIGVLGGICSGKSTVAAEFGKLGCAVIDADRIAHELLDDELVKDHLKKTFGPGILNPNGLVNRQSLGQIVFQHPKKVALVNRILHPRVLNRCESLIAEYNRRQDIPAIVLDMPLLLEVGWDKRCDKIIFVDAQEQIRAKRAQKQSIFLKNQLKKRENFQISLDTKTKIAHYIVDNNSDLSAMAEQVERIFTAIIE